MNYYTNRPKLMKELIKMQLISNHYLNKNKKHPVTLSDSAQNILKVETQRELAFFYKSFQVDWTLADIDYLANRIYATLLAQNNWVEREAIIAHLKNLYHFRSQDNVLNFTEKIQKLIGDLMMLTVPYVINNYPSPGEKSVRLMHYRDYKRYQELLEIIPLQLNTNAFKWLLEHLYNEMGENYYETLVKNYRNWYYTQGVSDCLAQQALERFLKETDYKIYFNILQKHFTPRKKKYVTHTLY